MPYSFAGRISTLDHLTNGRVRWNIVTGYLDGANRAQSGGRLPGHNRRYVLRKTFALADLATGSVRASAEPDGKVLAFRRFTRDGDRAAENVADRSTR